MDKKKGVLVIITGGNIGLIAKNDNFGNAVLEPVTIDDLKEIILCDGNASSIVLREQTLDGTNVPISFLDLRDTTNRRYHDPEELDSAQIDPSLWSLLTQTIRDKYRNHEGFVILHGLDTMAYTASALSFLLQNLQSPIILTGSQRPLNYPRTDALQNIYSSITLAACNTLNLKPNIPEVTVFSYDTLFRGNRASMTNASSYRSFDSPNFPHLCTVGEHITYQTHLIRKGASSNHLNVKTEVDAKVVILDVFPGMDAAIIKSLAKENESQIKGVLLRTYGMGTAPTSSNVLQALEDLNKNKIVVMNVTQARSGRISHGSDPVSLRLFEQGVISGVDMTAEAAYSKMVIYCSEKNNFEEISDSLQIEHYGEQSLSIFNIHFPSGDTKEESSADKCMATLIPKKNITGGHLIDYSLIKNIQIRLLGLEPVAKEEGKPVNRTIELELSLVDPTVEHKKIAHHLKSDILRWSSKGRNTINIAYDVTEAKDKLLSPGDMHMPSTYLLIETNEPIKWTRCQFVIFAAIHDK